MKELEECTFRPKVSPSHNDRNGSVFEKLNHSDLKEKEKVYQKIRDHKEMNGCTFKPKINSAKQFSSDNSFSKLYKDAEIQRQKIRNIELNEKDKDLENCTFRPLVKGSAVESSENVYEKLYNNFQEIQKERKRKQVESQEKEIAEVQFVPRLVTPQKGSSEVPVYARLYAEVEKRKEKMKKKTEEREQERSKSATRMRKPDEPPRFEHLYALHREKKDKQAALQEKYFKESGIVFKPNTSKKDIKVHRQYSPKGPYPMPKNPYSDISSFSSHN